VPLNVAGDSRCMTDALRSEFGAEHVTATEYSTLVEHGACLTESGRHAHVTYAIASRDGTEFFTLSAGYKSTARLLDACRPQLREELRRAISSFVAKCAPALKLTWTSNCKLTGAHAAEQACPDVGNADLR
jgi:hypothetical protein